MVCERERRNLAYRRCVQRERGNGAPRPDTDAWHESVALVPEVIDRRHQAEIDSLPSAKKGSTAQTRRQGSIARATARSRRRAPTSASRAEICRPRQSKGSHQAGLDHASREKRQSRRRGRAMPPRVRGSPRADARRPSGARQLENSHRCRRRQRSARTCASRAHSAQSTDGRTPGDASRAVAHIWTSRIRGRLGVHEEPSAGVERLNRRQRAPAAPWRAGISAPIGGGAEPPRRGAGPEAASGRRATTSRACRFDRRQLGEGSRPAARDSRRSNGTRPGWQPAVRRRSTKSGSASLDSHRNEASATAAMMRSRVGVTLTRNLAEAAGATDVGTRFGQRATRHTHERGSACRGRRRASASASIPR